MIFAGRCFRGNVSGELCSSGQLCSATWSYKELQKGCVENIASQLVIITKINVATSTAMQTIKFFCNYDECNGDRVVAKGKAYIDQYYDISPLYEALGYNESMDVTLVTSTTISSTYSQSPEKPTTTPLSSTTTTRSTTTVSSTTSIPKSGCSPWRSESTMMTVALAVFLILLATHCFNLH
jgi:hypothetical protein